ncbi:MULTISPECIES: hypothetical protein [unclassified Pseudomonas]|uniref:hypothetical protein n=1 Tax=unclassified Pseudomonas TaxID=196821 RepID=UPI00111C3095|nr:MULTISPECIES: hypothetical protein [unclassified Pseudomonas]
MQPEVTWRNKMLLGIVKLNVSSLKNSSPESTERVDGAKSESSNDLSKTNLQRIENGTKKFEEVLACAQLQSKTKKRATTDFTSVSASSQFTEWMHKTPAERIRAQLLKEMGLTEEDVVSLPQEEQDWIAKEVAKRVKEEQEQHSQKI